MGVLSGFGEFGADDPNAIHLATHMFTVVSGLSFMLFNQLNIPCFAAVGAIRDEMQDKKWTLFALGYQTLFAYTISFMVYQFGMVFVEGHGFNGWTAGAVVVLLAYIYLLFRKPKAVKNNSISAVSASEK